MDGLGWLPTKRGMLMREFGWSYEHVRLGLTGAQSWVWYNWARENLMTAFGPVYERNTDGYVRQETKRLMKIADAAVKRRGKSK